MPTMTDSNTTAQTGSHLPAAANARRRGPASPRYYVCLALLIISAIGMQALARALGGYFRKEAVPLKQPLLALDWRKLEPAYRPHLIQAPSLNEEQLQALGTHEYTNMRVIDVQREREDPVRVANIFITYYTGQPDMVPHVPDECYLAGGYDPVGGPQTTTVSVPGVGAPDDEIPIRVLEFQSREGEDRPTVLYFFHVNGDYKTRREEVRVRLANLLERYAYYAKIEVSFTNDPDNTRPRRYAGRMESLQALEALLRGLMPVLLEDHLAWEERVMSDQLGTEDQEQE
ncbi:MAG: exosortase-associated EpsI family protein [Planctomycetota bacterium]